MDKIRALAQAAADAYDGGTDANGEPLKIGLRREKGDYVKDSRHMDGFKVRFAGDTITITYQTDILLREVYAGGFEEEMENVMADIAKYLVKRAGEINGGKISLTSCCDVDVLVQSTSNVRSFVTASKKYKIGGMGSVETPPQNPRQDNIVEGFRDFLNLVRG